MKIKSWVLFWVIIGSFNSYCQTYKLDSFELERAIYKKFNELNVNITHQFQLNKVVAYKNDSMHRHASIKDDYLSDLTEPDGLTLLYKDERDIEKGSFNFSLRAIGCRYPAYFAGIKLSANPKFYVPLDDIEKKVSYRDLMLIKSTASLLFNSSRLFDYVSNNNQTFQQYYNESEQFKIKVNSRPFVYRLELDSLQIVDLNKLIISQFANGMYDFIKNEVVFFYKDSLLKETYTSNEGKLLIYEKILVNQDSSQLKQVYYFEALTDRLRRITFTKKAIGFVLQDSTFYVSYNYVKSQPNWFKLFCTVWDRDTRKF